MQAEILATDPSGSPTWVVYRLGAEDESFLQALQLERTQGHERADQVAKSLRRSPGHA
jgi:hypothetical protein